MIVAGSLKKKDKIDILRYFTPNISGCAFATYKRIERNRHGERVHNLVIPEQELSNDDIADDDLLIKQSPFQP